MSKVRVLVGTRKGAFILTADGRREQWEVSGPHFPGLQIYHAKGSPADPDRPRSVDSENVPAAVPSTSALLSMTHSRAGPQVQEW